jgi:NAD(P) transhydrogenase subunit alpha
MNGHIPELHNPSDVFELGILSVLHTPLMSLTNAISAISVVGGILIAGAADVKTLPKILGLVAVTAAMLNIVAGFMITDRMLKMFKREPGKGGKH